MDIKDEIDRSFGSGPDGGAGVEDVLLAGRRALLRRRLSVGAGALATVAIIGGTTWAATGSGGDRAEDAPVAGGPAPAGSPPGPPAPAAHPAPPRAGRPPTSDASPPRRSTSTW